MGKYWAGSGNNLKSAKKLVTNETVMTGTGLELTTT